MSMPGSRGQIALSGGSLSVAESPKKKAVTASPGSHRGHKSGEKKTQQNPFLTGLKICSSGLRGN